VGRGLKALLDGRLPYQLQTPFDRVMLRAGRPYRRLTLGEFQVLIRRHAPWDEAAARRVIEQKDYTRPGHEIGPTDTVIDIGANIGCFALVAGKAASRGRVLAFEPDPGNFELVIRNVELNRLSNVTGVQCAVSGKPGTLRLFQGAHGPLHTTLTDRVDERASVTEVTAVTLPQIMDRYHIERCDFLKMNCEGAEYEILYNTPADYLRRIDRIALEYHATRDKEQVSRQLAEFLADNGFRIFEFTDFVGFDCGYIRGTRR
jgi:FkbM family methyltransferase